MILQLDPPISLETPKGEMLAHFLISYGPEEYFYFFGCLTDSAEWWYFDNTKVRGTKNYTWGRTSISPIAPHGNCGTEK